MMSWSKILRLPALVLPITVVTMFLSMLVAGLANALPACGGGGRIVNAGSLSLSNCEVSGQTTPGNGGGVFNEGDLTLTNVVISGNHADGDGGGIYNAPAGTLTLINVVITGNSADGFGGGIVNDGGGIMGMSNVTVGGNTAADGNTAGLGGGGIANFANATAFGAALAVAHNTTFAGNGGGILNDGKLCVGSGSTYATCTSNLSGGNSLVTGNHASTGSGGGIANTNALALSDSTVDSNGADAGDGGGIWTQTGTGVVIVLNATISHNIATGNGGGVFTDDGGGFFATNVTLVLNQGSNGGGAYTANSGFTFLGFPTIADNRGGGVYNDDASGGSTELQSTLLARNGTNCVGTTAGITSDGNNLDTGTTCPFTDPPDQTNVGDANVGLSLTLAANGGPPQGSSQFTTSQGDTISGVSADMMTLALDPTSPAIDAGGASCPPPGVDERGIHRPQQAACDVGAFELELALSCLNANPLLGVAATGGKLCTILQVDAGKVNITGAAGQIQGNICIGPNGKLSMSGDNFATNPGEILLDATASCSGCQIGKRVNSVDQPVDLSAEITACKEAATDNQPAPAGLLTCGPLSRQTLTGTQTILGAVGKNVICVDNVNVGNNQLITLSRDPAAVGPDTTFVFVVTGKFVIQGKIKADGTTVQPAGVLYNVIGTGRAIAFSGGGGGTRCCKAEIDGTLIALDRKWAVSPGLINGQACGGRDMSFTAGSGVHCPAP